MKTIVPNTGRDMVGTPTATATVTAMDHFDVIAWAIETTADGGISVTPVTPFGDVTTSKKHWAIWDGTEWRDPRRYLLNVSEAEMLDLWRDEDEADEWDPESHIGHHRDD